MGLRPQSSCYIKKQYQVAMHAWFLDQVSRVSSSLSQILHDEQQEKAFTIANLKGELRQEENRVNLLSGHTYYLKVTALSQPVALFLHDWIKNLPELINLYGSSLKIIDCQVSLKPNTYSQLWQKNQDNCKTVKLSFVTPTSFRRKGHHFPLPVPVSLFHSYLRRWNCFCDRAFEQDPFLDWIEESVIILRHQLISEKIQVAKSGSVTGFLGAIELNLDKSALKNLEYTQLFYTLSDLAPYCGTGHKTPFGLGETVSGWFLPEMSPFITPNQSITERITELKALFLARRLRQGGNRGGNMADKLATILARRESGESLQAIALDLKMPYETVKTYAKLARREIRQSAYKV
ncbi:CRISPR-associated endoribonuclease Cas6 [Gloeocapsa sp. PCC 73106]|nr:CRISPR-associated endoribonuclease Cas6 [Gloeocapsa sp. PCC 73106]